jgi:hypothetical protein
MTQLSSYETTPGNIGTLVQGQSPSLWDCLCFLNNDIQPASDSRYGKIYSLRAGVGSHNPYYDPGPGAASAELSRRRPNDLGKWDWFAGGFKINSGLTAPGWVVLYQFGYPTLSSPPLSLNVVHRKGLPTFEVYRNAGLLRNNGAGFYKGSAFEERPFLRAPYGKWVDIVIGVKWATDNTGELRVYSRVERKSRYKLSLSESNTPTEQYGTTPYGTVSPDFHESPTVIDHGGLYYGYYDQRTSFPTESLLQTGITRSSDFATAASTLP